MQAAAKTAAFSAKMAVKAMIAAVKMATDTENGMDVATLDDTKISILYFYA